MVYQTYDYWGMNVIWWFIWMSFLIWIFFTPYSIPFERRRKDTPLYILKKRFAAGHITKETYEEHKALLEKDAAN